MHWNNIFTIIVAAVVGGASYLGVRQATKDAIKARDEEASLEHRRWFRERRAEIYADTVAWIDWRHYRRSQVLATALTGLDMEPIDNPITVSPHVLSARMNLFGSSDVVKLLLRSQEADRRAYAARALVDERAQRMRDGAEPTMSLLEDSKEAERLKREADEADNILVDTMTFDLGKPLNAHKEKLSPKLRKELEA